MSGGYDNDYCPQCGDICIIMFDTKPWELTIGCPMCGYSYKERPLWDRKKQAADPEHRLFYKRTKDERLIYRTFVRKGFGVCHVAKKTGEKNYWFRKHVTQNQINWYQKLIASPDVNSEQSYLTRWNDETQQLETVIGTPINPNEDSREDIKREYSEEESRCKDEGKNLYDFDEGLSDDF